MNRSLTRTAPKRLAAKQFAAVVVRLVIVNIATAWIRRRMMRLLLPKAAPVQSATSNSTTTSPPLSITITPAVQLNQRAADALGEFFAARATH